MAVAQGSKPVKKASAPKKSKAAPSHPPYIDMIKEALVSLKERTGSSTYAIAKHIEEKQKVGDLPPNFRKLLAIQIKKFVASGKLVKVKNSFKLPPASTNATAKTTTTKPKPKAKETAPKKKTTTSKPKAAAVKKVMKSPVKKVAVVKAKKPKSIKSPVKKSPVAKKAKK